MVAAGLPLYFPPPREQNGLDSNHTCFPLSVLVRCAKARAFLRTDGEGYSGPLLGPAANPEQVADRVFWSSCEVRVQVAHAHGVAPRSQQREALRRGLLLQLEEEQRSDATQIDQKTTGATFEGFETSRQLESGLRGAHPRRS